MSIRDEMTLTRGDRVIGYMGKIASSFTLAWLASHRGRLRTWIFGGRRLSLLIVWDDQGNREVDRTDADLEAIRRLTFGGDGRARAAHWSHKLAVENTGDTGSHVSVPRPTPTCPHRACDLPTGHDGPVQLYGRAEHRTHRRRTVLQKGEAMTMAAPHCTCEPSIFPSLGKPCPIHGSKANRQMADAQATAVERLSAENKRLRELYENVVQNREQFGWTINHLLECEDALRMAEEARDEAHAVIDAVREVLDRGTADDRRLATINRLVNAYTGEQPASKEKPE